MAVHPIETNKEAEAGEIEVNKEEEMIVIVGELLLVRMIAIVSDQEMTDLKEMMTETTAQRQAAHGDLAEHVTKMALQEVGVSAPKKQSPPEERKRTMSGRQFLIDVNHVRPR